eukprot:6912939-Pyramimonas_sp.AAC.1
MEGARTETEHSVRTYFIRTWHPPTQGRSKSAARPCNPPEQLPQQPSGAPRRPRMISGRLQR